jgi:hypothetical protein
VSHHQPSGQHRGLDLLIDPHWPPDQVLAVIELLDDPRDRIRAHDEFTSMTTFRDERVTHHAIEIDDPPF